MPPRIEICRSHADTHTVGLWTSDQPNEEAPTYTTQHKIRKIHTNRDSSPRSQQSSGRRPTPKTAWPAGYAIKILLTYNLQQSMRKMWLRYRTLAEWMRAHSLEALHQLSEARQNDITYTRANWRTNRCNLVAQTNTCVKIVNEFLGDRQKNRLKTYEKSLNKKILLIKKAACASKAPQNPWFESI